jgi:hypothetical protein
MVDVAVLAARTSVVPGRSCGSCSMCCKLYDLPEVQSPAGKWCRHCAPGKGCTIHETRPEVCRKFFCGWMVSPGLGPEWKPERAKLIVRLVVPDGEMPCLAVDVDEGYPDAWRRPDIYGKLKQIATSGGVTGGSGMRVVVRVRIGRRLIEILPDRDVDVGIVADDEDVQVTTSGALASRRQLTPSRLSGEEQGIRADEQLGQPTRP